MGQAILLITLIIALVTVGAIAVGWISGELAKKEDAQAQRMAQEAALARARGDAEASIARARADARVETLTALFPWLVVVVLGLAVAWGGYIALTRPTTVQGPYYDPHMVLALARLQAKVERLEDGEQGEVLRLPIPAHVKEGERGG